MDWLMIELIKSPLTPPVVGSFDFSKEGNKSGEITHSIT